MKRRALRQPHEAPRPTRKMGTATTPLAHALEPPPAREDEEGPEPAEWSRRPEVLAATLVAAIRQERGIEANHRRERALWMRDDFGPTIHFKIEECGAAPPPKGEDSVGYARDWLRRALRIGHLLAYVGP